MAFERETFELLLETARAARRRRRERLARLVGIRRTAARAPAADAIDVRAVRQLTALSQAKFAELLGIELATLRNWEQGRTRPDGPARVLLRVIERRPRAVEEALG